MRLFAGRHLGAHVANRSRAEALHGCIRGEDLARRLVGRFHLSEGRSTAMGGATMVPDDALIEVYPHAALIAWFDLPAPLAYERGTLDKRREGLESLAGMLRGLRREDPALDLDRAWWLPDRGEWGHLAGPALDQVESLLDATIAAHAARHCRRWGSERCRCAGGEGEGAIVTPVPAAAHRQPIVAP